MRYADIREIIFYDVDTQKDFMDVDGKLYVPEAEDIRPNLAKLTRYAKDQGIKILGSVDRHSDGDAELETFPPHCMDGSIGQEKISETAQDNVAYIPNHMVGSVDLMRDIIGSDTVYFEKQHYDVFTNPHAEGLLSAPKLAVVYGVATDYCVKAAVLGMRERGVEVLVVEDAIKGISQETVEEAVKEMKEKGVRFVSTQDILEDILGE